MSRFSLSATNRSSFCMNPKKSEFQIKKESLELPLPDSKLGDPDITFRAGCDIFHGHQRVFQSMSSQLKRCFEFLSNGFTGCTPLQLGGVLKITKSEKSMLTITIDANGDTFNLFFEYCYGDGLSVPIKKLPPLYLLAKRLDVPSLHVPCSDYLSKHITLEVIGELSRLVEFSVLEYGIPQSDCGRQEPTNESTVADLRLASAAHDFLQQKADLVASSSTGQLSARLLVNLTIDPQTSGSRERLQDGDVTGSREDNSVATTATYSSQRIAFAILRWGHERVTLGERLARSGSEENVLSDDEDSEASGGHSNAVSMSDLSQQLPPRTDPVGKRRYHSGGGGPASFPDRPTDGQITRLKLENRCTTDDDDDDIALQWDRRKVKRHRLTQDIRIALEMKELEMFLADDGIPNSYTGATLQDPCSSHPSALRLLSYCPKDGGAEMETCLLAQTGLGAGATSIWLGKLTGHLVSLSLKFCRPSSPGPVLNHGANQILGDSQLFARCDSPSIDLSCPNVCLSGNNHVQTCGDLDDEVALTMTPTSASHLAKAAAAASLSSLSLTSSTSQGVDGDWSPQEGSNPRNTGLLTQLIEARSGAGAGFLCSEAAPGVESQLYLLVVGGYTRKGCLDAVELFASQPDVMNWSSDLGLRYALPGPLLGRLRGRLAVATTMDGSPLSSDSLGPSAMYACGGSNGSVDLASVELLTSKSLSDWLASATSTTNSVHIKESARLMAPPWKPVHNMHQSRSSPCAIGLSGVKGLACLPGSVLVAGGVTGCTPLPSVECFVAGRDEWIALPQMREARCEATGALLLSKQLVVVAGGTTVSPNGGGPSGCQKSNFIEALDLRCSQWISLPSPPVSGGLRRSCLVSSPTSEDGLLMIGGFNGCQPMDTVWQFDATAWQWCPYTPMIIARSSACAVTWPNRSGTVVIGGFNMTASASGFLDSIELLRSF